MILWSTRRHAGVFNIANRATRERLENEEIPFVLGTITQEPFDELGAAFINWGRQLVYIQVDDPLRNRLPISSGDIGRQRACPS